MFVPPCPHVPAVDEHGGPVLAHGADELVHDPARHPGKLVLRRLAGESLGPGRASLAT